MSADHRQPIVPVILSGGSGTRLWPLSRRARPKQMLDLAGGGTDAGADRRARRPMRSCSRRRWWSPARTRPRRSAQALPKAGTLILEPAARNTAPAIALAALDADARRPPAGPAQRPSGRRCRPASATRSAGRAPFARDGWIVTFGMKAERARPAIGYIERGAALGEGVHQAVRFVEKPDAATAGRYAASGRHDWNGGIFLMRAGTYLDALQEHAPKIAKAAKAAMAGAERKGRPPPARRRRLRRLALALDRLCGDGEGRQGRGRAGRDRLVRRRQLGRPARSARARRGTAMR